MLPSSNFEYERIVSAMLFYFICCSFRGSTEMSGNQNTCEVPLQDYARIQLMYLPSAISNGKLFTDYSFPPDKSSLTYVYSGDDRYDKMVFKRPKVWPQFVYCTCFIPSRLYSVLFVLYSFTYTDTESVFTGVHGLVDILRAHLFCLCNPCVLQISPNLVFEYIQL